MTWNYRVIKKDGEDGDVYCIHEIYYGENDKINLRTVEGIAPYGETLKELQDDLTHMLVALTLPVLDEKELDRELDKE